MKANSVNPPRTLPLQPDVFDAKAEYSPCKGYRYTRNVDLAAASRACPQGIDIAARLEVARKALAA